MHTWKFYSTVQGVQGAHNLRVKNVTTSAFLFKKKASVNFFCQSLFPENMIAGFSIKIRKMIKYVRSPQA